MKASLTLLIVIALLSCNNTNSFDKTNADPLEVGVAVVDITPPVGFPLYGYPPKPSTGIRRENGESGSGNIGRFKRINFVKSIALIMK